MKSGFFLDDLLRYCNLFLDPNGNDVLVFLISYEILIYGNIIRGHRDLDVHVLF